MTISYSTSEHKDQIKLVNEQIDIGNAIALQEEEIKMETIKEAALAHEQKQTRNIADLDKVDVNMNMDTREATDKNGKPFKYKVAIIDDKEYRVPGVVLGDLKKLIEVKPNMTTFKVTKTGESLQTRYTVIPLD